MSESTSFAQEQKKNVHDCYNTIAAITCYAQFLIDDLPAESEMHKFSKSIFLSSKRAKLLLDEITHLPVKEKEERKRVV